MDALIEALSAAEKLRDDAAHVVSLLSRAIIAQGGQSRSVGTPCGDFVFPALASSGVHIPEDVLDHIDACGE